MHIAQIAPLTEAIPPKLYGGTERVVSWLTEELIALGHDVTLFASGDSVTSAKLEAMWPRALRLDGSVRDPNALHMMMLEKVYERAADFDVLHCHLDYYPFSLFSRQPTPFVTTLHGRLDLPEHQPVFDTFSSAPVVSISNSQRRPLPQANWVRTVLHGLPVRLLEPKPIKPSYFAFLGRIAPEKGIDRAIRIAQHCGVQLKVAAKVDRADREYYDEKIAPMMKSANVDFIGEINDMEKSEFLSGAIALLVPIDWPEPFGLVMIEAMACGTPVIAYNRGSVPEIIEDGLTGFVVEDEAGAIGSVICRAKKSASVSKSDSPRAAWRRIILASIAAFRCAPNRVCGWSLPTRRRFSRASSPAIAGQEDPLPCLSPAAFPASSAIPP
jgi:glycosyltransferase involved in cell wall biosynthesis